MKIKQDHFLQSKTWKSIKEEVGNPTFEFNGGWCQITDLPGGIRLGYVPRPNMEEIDISDLYHKAEENNCTFVTIDPNHIVKTESLGKREDIEEFESVSTQLEYPNSKGRPIQLQNTVMIDASKTEEGLLEDMKRKYRYNIRLSAKKGIRAIYDDSEEAFETFLKLYLKTKERHDYDGRGEQYIKAVWKNCKKASSDITPYIGIAYNPEDGDRPLVAWFMLIYKNNVYLPYAGSSNVSRELKPTYLIVWETLQWMKKNNYRFFDFGGLEEKIGDNDGFSSYKLGFGGSIVTYQDSIDLIMSPLKYRVLKIGMLARDKFSFIKNRI